MTSELQQRREVEPEPVALESSNCACCCHFAVDLDAIPEATGKRRARLPKRKAVVATALESAA
jgi:hypothetical protein